jgi:methyl-accepting chemotaxis protein
MQGATGRSVAAIQAIVETVRALNQFSARIATSVDQQAASAQNIAGDVNDAAGGVDVMAGAISEIKQIANTTADAASELMRSAAEMTKQTGRIRDRMYAFAEEIRASQG